MNHTDLKKIKRELFSLSFPMAFTQLVAVGSGFLSMAMLSGLGQEVLAASALIFSARISIIIIGSSILFSLSILIGHAYGEKKYQSIGNYMQQGWLLGLMFSIPIMIIFWNMGEILIYFGQSSIIAHIVADFFHANVWSVIPFLLGVSNQQLCYGTRKQKIDLWANVLGVFILLISAYLLILGRGGFPKLGVRGLAIALNLQGWFYFLFTSFIIYFNDFFKRFDLFKMRIHQHFTDFVHMFEIGWPISIQISGELLSFFVSAAMVGWLGTQSLAAYQVVTQYIFLVLVPIFAVGQAAGVLIGQSYGEKNYLKIIKIGHAGILFSCIISFTGAFLFIMFPKFLASLYLDVHQSANRETLHLIIVLFLVMGIQQILDGIRNTLTGSLRGVLDTRFPMIVGLCVIWLIGIPLGYFFAFPLGYGVLGIAIGTTVGLFIGMIVLIYRWGGLKLKFIESSLK